MRIHADPDSDPKHYLQYSTEYCSWEVSIVSYTEYRTGSGRWEPKTPTKGTPSFKRFRINLQR